MAEYRIKVEPIKVPMTPWLFARLAEDFLQAAHDLPKQRRSSTVLYYLVCRSLELGLKAYCLAKGDKQKKFLGQKGIGHSLVKALERANALGLDSLVTLSAQEEDELRKADVLYANKGFEFVTPAMLRELVTGQPRYPDLTVLTALADRITPPIERICRDITMA